MYCNNCGLRGHLFRSCKEPVISYGLILVDRKPRKVLMIRRKDSMAYTEFICGKYDLNDTEYITKLISNMTDQEQSRLMSTCFDEIWTLHWGVGRDHKSNEYANSKSKFEKLNVSTLITSCYSEPEWGFPKGRRLHKETDIDCAIREFGEETNITPESYIVYKNITFTESFVGTNGVKYRHIYFLAFPVKQLNIEKPMSETQRREVSLVGWKTINECRNLKRPHHVERDSILDSLNSILDKFDLDENQG